MAYNTREVTGGNISKSTMEKDSPFGNQIKDFGPMYLDGNLRLLTLTTTTRGTYLVISVLLILSVLRLSQLLEKFHPFPLIDLADFKYRNNRKMNSKSESPPSSQNSVFLGSSTFPGPGPSHIVL